jgi:hypothetical protein
MKRLFGKEKQKMAKVVPLQRENVAGADPSTQIQQPLVEEYAMPAAAENVFNVERHSSHRDREREDDELTRMIGASSTLSIMMEHSSICRRAGYSTASSVEDWALALEICERASANETNAKEAATALRREFKYGEPPLQLSTARVHLHFFYYLQS